MCGIITIDLKSILLQCEFTRSVVIRLHRNFLGTNSSVVICVNVSKLHWTRAASGQTGGHIIPWLDNTEHADRMP